MPTFDAHPNFAYSTIAVVPSAGASASAGVAAGTGGRFSGGPFDAVICPAGTAPTPANAEVVRVLAQSGDTVYIARQQESSSLRSVQVGDAIYVAPTGKPFTDIETALNALSTRVTLNSGSRAYKGTATLGMSGSWQRLIPDTISYDPGSHFSTGNGRYTCPNTGWYQVNGQVSVNATAAAQVLQCAIYQNGAVVSYGNMVESPASGENYANVSDLIYANAGDYLELYVQGTAGPRTTSGSAANNYISVVQVDQPMAGTLAVAGTPNGVTFYNGGGTPTGITGQATGSYCIRKVDSEVFQWNGNAWIDQGFSLAATNAVTSSVTRAYLSGNQSISAANTWTKAQLANVADDPGSNWSTTAYHYTAPVSGYYHVTGQMTYGSSAANGQNVAAMIGVNDAVSDARCIEMASYVMQAADFPPVFNGSGTIKLAAGETLSLFGYSSAAGIVMSGAENDLFLMVHLVAPLTNAPVQPGTGARAYRNAAFTLPSNAWTKVPIDTVAAGNDPGSHMDVVTNNRYNVSVTGWYHVSGNVTLNDASADFIGAAIYKNGAQSCLGLGAETTSSNAYPGASVSDLIYCTAGDYLELWGLSGAAAEPLGVALGNVVNYLSVVLVDQPSGQIQQNQYTYFYSGTGTPTGFTAPPANAYCIRQIDGEVFQYVNSVWVDQNFSVSGQNAVTPTVARAYRSSAMNLTANTWTKVPMNSASIANAALDTASTYRYTAPISGYYEVTAQVGITAASGMNFLDVAIYKNGVLYSQSVGAQDETGAYNNAPFISDIVQCNSGDYIEIYAFSTAASPVVTGATQTFCSMALIAPLTNAPSNPNTGARAYRNAALTLTANSVAKVPLDTVAAGNDPGAHFDVTTNHRYNVASAGWYQVNSQVTPIATGPNQNVQAQIYHNGAVCTIGNNSQSDTSGGIATVANDLIYCAAGDYIELYCYSTTALSLGVGQAFENYMSVVKVDQPTAPSNTGWQTATLTSPWTANGTSQVVQYMKDANGFVHLRGSMFAAAIQGNTPAFTLPAGFRPGPSSDIYPAFGGGGTAGLFYGIVIASSGVVQASTQYANQAIYLNSITFLAEN